MLQFYRDFNIIPQSIHKYRIHIGVFMFVFILLYVVYSRFGMTLDLDSDSYFYIARVLNGQHRNIPDLMRPPVYPLVIALAHVFGKSGSFILYLFFIHLFVLSAGFTLLYDILRKLFREKLVVWLILGICVINYPALKHINYVIPEVFLTAVMVLFLYFSLAFQQNKKYMMPMIVSLTLLTMIKPVFLYFPITMGVVFWLLYLLRVIGKKYLLMFIVGCLFLYVTPVLLWSYGNKVINQNFIYSNIQSINMLGKLQQYELADKGPDYASSIPMKRLMGQYHGTDPYRVIRSYINPRGLYSSYHGLFYTALDSYTRQTIVHNIFQYSIQSVRQLYTTIQNPPLYPAPTVTYECRINVADIGCLLTSYVMIEYNFYYVSIIRTLFPLLVLLSIMNVFRHIILLSRNKSDAYSYAFIMLFTLIAYYLVMFAIGAYDSFERLIAPIYFEVIVLFGMTMKDCVALTASVIKKARKARIRITIDYK